jgi:hypothetical protein
MSDMDIGLTSPEQEEFMRSSEYQGYLKTCRGLIKSLLDSRGVTTLSEVTNREEANELRARIKEILDSNKPKATDRTAVQRSLSMPTLYETATEYYQRKNPGTKYRFCNRNDKIQADWRAKGFRPVVAEDDKFGDKGAQIIDGDLVLMSCPMEAFVENVRKPVKAKKDYRRNALTQIEQSFKESGARAGIETFGSIKTKVTTDEA